MPDKLGVGWGAEEGHFQHRHLSMAQIHAALSYYYDHQEEFEAQIEHDVQEVEAMAAEAQDSPFRRPLRDMSKLP